MDPALSKLLSPSSLFEADPASTLPAWEGLDRMEGLEAMIRMSLEPVEAEPAAAPPPVPGKGPWPRSQQEWLASRGAEAPVRVETSRREYEAALQDDAIVRALLEFQRLALPPAPALEGPSPEMRQREADRLSLEGARGGPQALDAFAHPRVPAVQAEPKPSPIRPKRAADARGVLRPSPAG